jgi:hypothetical protein
VTLRGSNSTPCDGKLLMLALLLQVCVAEWCDGGGGGKADGLAPTMDPPSAGWLLQLMHCSQHPTAHVTQPQVLILEPCGGTGSGCMEVRSWEGGSANHCFDAPPHSLCISAPLITHTVPLFSLVSVLCVCVNLRGALSMWARHREGEESSCWW